MNLLIWALKLAGTNDHDEYCVNSEGSINSVTAKSHTSPSPPSPSSLFHVVEGMITRSSYSYAINGQSSLNIHWDLLSNCRAQVGNGKSLGNLEGVFSIGQHMDLSHIIADGKRCFHTKMDAVDSELVGGGLVALQMFHLYQEIELIFISQRV